MNQSYTMLVGIIIAAVIVLGIIVILVDSVSNSTAAQLSLSQEAGDTNIDSSKSSLVNSDVVTNTLNKLKQSQTQKEYDENVAKSK